MNRKNKILKKYGIGIAFFETFPSFEFGIQKKWFCLLKISATVHTAYIAKVIVKNIYYIVYIFHY